MDLRRAWLRSCLYNSRKRRGRIDVRVESFKGTAKLAVAAAANCRRERAKGRSSNWGKELKIVKIIIIEYLFVGGGEK